MFIQVFQAKVRDPGLWEQRAELWQREIKPLTKGFLGYTSGVTATNQMITVARFESEAVARANSDLAAQGSWFEETKKAFDGEPTFHDCREVDVILDGGSDKAGFVQVMQGRSQDPSAMRAAGSAAEAELRKVRPDLLGGIVAWHGDGGFTMVSYFTSEAEARINEKTMAEDPSFKKFDELIEGPTTFFDLSDPTFG